MAKVAIIGGLGYIGTALRQIYEATEHKVTTFDNMFLPYMTKKNNFRDRKNETFVLCDIRDYKDFDIEKYDIVYNLAAITSTKAEDKKLIDEINHKCAVGIAEKSKRYVFASSCNVFAGNQEKGSFDENDIIMPNNPYAESKANVECWLQDNHNDFIICRFGANYGYSDGMKYAPMGNVFMLNSIFNKPITVHGDGTNYRPMCHVKDTARALYFLAHHEEVKCDVFHIVNMNTTISGLANKIKQIHPSLKIQFIEGKKQQGYRISNKKMQQLGFKFENNLEKAYEELKWSCYNWRKI